MKRASTVLLMLLALSACTARERPEGIVERWLSALNQGSAGGPDRYAARQVSDAVLPGWEHETPGSLDVIEVGPASSGDGAGDARTGHKFVPFRFETASGTTFLGVVVVEPMSPQPIVQLLRHPPDPSAFEAGGRSLGSAGLSLWLEAFGIGAFLILVFEGAMRFARRGASR